MWESSSASYSPVRRGSPSPGPLPGPSALQQWPEDGQANPPSNGSSVGSPGNSSLDRRSRSTGPAGSSSASNRRRHQSGPRSGSPSLQPPASRSNSLDNRRRARTRSDSPNDGVFSAPRTRAYTEGERLRVGGSVGVPGTVREDEGPMSRVRSSSMDLARNAQGELKIEQHRKLTESDFTKDGGLLSALGTLPGSRRTSSSRSATDRGGSGSPKPIGGSVGVPGSPGMPLAGRPRSQTEGALTLSSMRNRSVSPHEDGLLLMGSDSEHPSEFSYVPREPVLESTSSSKYAPFDRQYDMEDQKENSDLNLTAHPGPVSERDISLIRLGVLCLGWLFCCISWLLGVTLDSARLDVLPGTTLHWVMERSLINTLNDLSKKHLYVSMMALGFFSIVVPVAKLGGTFKVIYEMYSKPAHRVFDTNRYLLNVLSYLASYQFVDLYVGILFVCYFNSDASSARFHIGFYWFFSYCVISLAVSVVLEGTLYFETPGSDERDSEKGPWAASLLGSQSRSEGQVSARHKDFFGRGADMTDSGPPRNPSTEEEGGSPYNRDSYLPGKSAYTAEKQKSLETYPDMITTRFFCACFFLPLLICCFQPFLEVRMLLHQVAVERTVLSLSEIIFHIMPARAHPVVVIFMWVLNVVCPVMYGAALMVRVEHRHRHMNFSEAEWREERFSLPWFCRLASEAFRQWAHIDVVAIAAMIFLFMIQDEDTLTMTPDGSFAFYIFLASGFSFFFLRWFTEHEADDKQPWSRIMGVTCRTASLIAVYVTVCMILLGGVPGAAPHYQYRSLSSVCRHAQPFLDQVADQLPATFGNCKDKDSNPPQPCMGHENLQTHHDGDDRMDAIWMGGLRTLSFSSCHLTKVASGSPSRYRLRVGGTFHKISMFLRVKTCPPIGGCIEMNSADHCCGKDIGFNFTFDIACKPDVTNNAIRAITLEDADLDPMLVQQKLLGGAMKIQAMDISEQVESSVKSHLSNMLHMQMKWGEQKVGVADMLNKIVMYNAPNQAGTCY